MNAKARRPACGRWVALGLGSALLAGCAINPKLDLAAVAGRSQPQRLEAVPFFPQTEYQCGPAALAGVLGAAGVSTSPQALSPQVYLPGRRGSLQMELLAATRRAGRIPYPVGPEPAALLAEVAAGRPVLVLQNLRTRHFPVWHYAVLVGFDPAANRIVLNSGRRHGLEQPADAFLRTWDWGGRFAMVALRPGEMPAVADPQRYAEAVTAFETVAAADAAEAAWQAAIEYWPADSRPWLALGNLAYGQGRHQAALRHYREGLRRAPEDPVLANNLASVLGESGCPRAGETVLGPLVAALPEDSPWRPAIGATLAELAARSGADPKHCAGFGGS